MNGRRGDATQLSMYVTWEENPHLAIEILRFDQRVVDLTSI